MKLSLSNPVTPFVLNQSFGGNYATYKQFGIQGHNGVDLQAYHGQPVYASHDGTVILEVDENQGHGVVLISDEMYDYKASQAYFKSIYWHFPDPLKEPKYQYPVKDGQHVKRGDLIGYADSTGFSTGDHLHFGLKPITVVTTASGFRDIYNTSNIEQNNGYQGAIDPMPYFNSSYSVDLPLDPNELIKDPNNIYPTIKPQSRKWWNLFWFFRKKG